MIFSLITLLVVAIIVMFVFLTSRTFEIKKSIVVNNDISTAFGYMKHIKNHDHWSPWRKKDRNIQQEFIGEDGKVGFISKWSGNSDVGVGEQEIINVVENKIVETKIKLIKPIKSDAIGIIETEDIGMMRTKVTLIFHAKNQMPTNILMLFFNLEKAVGKDFEEGLNNLKQLLEKK